MSLSMVQADMMRDGRTVSRAALEEMRLVALERMKEGESPAAVAASFGLHRGWAYKVLTKARGRGRGKRALLSSKGTGRPRTLTAAQERQVFGWVNGKNPRQYGFDFGLWTRQIVRELIETKFGTRSSLASVGSLLARIALTAQKPLQQAYQRDPVAVARWQQDTYPAIVRQAKREKPRSISGTNRASAPMRCRAGRGRPRDTRRWSRCLDSARVSVLPRRSTARAASGSPFTVAV